MSIEPHGELIPVGGGDTIPLVRSPLTFGRRDSCDVCLRLPNVSGLHCEMIFRDGFWWIFDHGSTNGTKVNGTRVPKKLLHPGDTISIARRTYTIEYTPPVGQRALEAIMEEEEDILGTPLLEKAGLIKPPRSAAKRSAKPAQPADPPRFDFEDDEEAE